MQNIMMTCFLCGAEFPMGPHAHHGRHIGPYQMTVCEDCYTAAREGWPPAWEVKLIEHLTQLALPMPARNAMGLLPRDG